MRDVHRLAGAMLAMLVCAGAGAESVMAQAAEGDVVTVTGRASVEAAPDRAFVTMTAEARAARPRDAQQRSANAMDRTRAVLREQGIADEAVRTLAYDVQPRYDYIEGRQVFREFIARNAIEVRVERIDALGGLLDRVVDAGATEVSGIRFDVADRAGLERVALERAVADAVARARAAAAGAGRTVDRVIRISDQVERDVPGPFVTRSAMAIQAEAAETPIAPGQIEIAAVVTLTAALR